MEKIRGLKKIGYEPALVPDLKPIVPQGIVLILDFYDRLSKESGKNLEGFRVDHALVILPPEFSRFKKYREPPG